MVRHLHTAWSSVSSLFTPTFLRKGAHYSAADIRADIVAGITVAVVQIPQSMALAIIAGLPAIYGLYASLPGWIASVWGSSKRLSTGPVAMVSLLTFTSLVPLAEPGSTQFIHLAALMALMVGCMYLALGLFRLGFILRAVPSSVVTGFSTAAAAIIVISQIPTLLGLSSVRHDLVIQDIAAIIRGISDLTLATAIVGVGALILLLLSRKLPKAFPSALIVAGGGVAAGYLFHLDTLGVALVAAIPPGLPSFALPSISLAQIFALLPKAAIITLVGFVGTLATAKNAARGSQDHIDTDQELVGQGLANIATSFWRGFPLGGSFTRTALTVETGARTELSSVVTAIATIVTVLFLTPILFYLPRAVLAAVVIAAALPLIDIERLRHMMRVSRPDGIVAYLTAGMAFIVRPDDAIFIGIIAALAFFIRETISSDRITELGVDRDWNILRAAIAEEKVETIPGTCVVRLGMSLYYANTEHLLSEVDRKIAIHELREHVPVRTLVLDMAGVHFVDITALEVLGAYVERARRRNLRVCFLYVRAPVREILSHAPALAHVHLLHNISELKMLVDAGPSAVVLS